MSKNNKSPEMQAPPLTQLTDKQLFMLCFDILRNKFVGGMPLPGTNIPVCAI
jgi:hypothetical protein